MIYLSERDNVTNACWEESKAYLGCRSMDKNHMAKENWSRLGFAEKDKHTKTEAVKS